MESFKNRAFEIIQPSKEGDATSKIFDRALTVLILLNTISCFIETFDSQTRFEIALNVFDLVSVAFFTIEYFFRIFTADLLFPQSGKVVSRLRYLVSPMGIIDLVSILPFYLPVLFGFDLRSLRLLRIIRFVRVFKLGGYISGLDAVLGTVKEKRHELISSISAILIFMLVSSMLVYEFEFEAQPEVFVNGFSGLWWAFETLTTVGYGDIYPITVPGKILSIAIALSGIVLIAVPSGIIASGLTEGTIRGGSFQHSLDSISSNKKQSYCAYCGHAVNSDNGRRFCTSCGNELDDDLPSH